MVTTLEEHGVGLRSLHEQLDTTSPTAGERSPDGAPEYVHGCGDSRTPLSLQPNGAPAMPDHNEASDEPRDAPSSRQPWSNLGCCGRPCRGR